MGGHCLPPLCTRAREESAWTRDADGGRRHEHKGDADRTEILIPSAAHGTNPATAVMCGYKVREVGVTKDGDVDIDELKSAVGPQTAGLMMTNPSTCGVFERRIQDIVEHNHRFQHP